MANFTPDLKPYTGQGKFRYWVQMVLPTIYDDSLSYMELLNKVVYALNIAIEDVATVEENVAALLNAFNELQEYTNEYFDNLDVQQEIEEKLDKMAEDGSLGTILAPYIPALVTAWLEENITPTAPAIDKSLNILDAAADAKIVGDYVFPSNNGNIVVGEFIENSYVDTSGQIKPYDGWHRTDYIEIDPHYPLYITKFGAGSSGRYCSFYDENKVHLVSFSLAAGENFRPMHNNVKYMILSDESSVYYRIGTHSNLYNDRVNKAEKHEENIFPFYGWVNGSINSEGAVIAVYDRILSDPIEVIPSATIRKMEYNSNYNAYINVFDAENNLLQQSVYDDPEFELPKNAAYIRIVARSLTNEFIYPSEVPEMNIYMYYVTEPYNDTAFEVITYNIGQYHYGTGDYGIPDDEYEEKIANYRNFLGSQFPAIMGLQEFSTVIRKEPEVRSEPALWDKYYPYRYRTGSSTAIQSRYPLNDGGYHTMITDPTRYYVDAYTVINGKQVYLLSVHLSPTAGEAGRQKRLAEINEVKNILAGHEYAICFGDFNPYPGEEEELYSVLTDEGYKLANYGELGKFWTWSSNREDFNHYDEPTGTIYYIDNIIVTPNIDILTTEVLNVYNYLSSDHIPIKAKLVLK